MVRDVNDAAECNDFVCEIHSIGIENACTTVGPIHFNPGTDKTRGHLGSQLERKAETNLRLDKVGEITEVWSEKQRRAPIPKGTGPRFQWGHQESMHVSIATAREAEDSKKRKRAKHLRDEIYDGRQAMRYLELLEQVQNTLNVSLSTAKRRFTEWV